jgi:hypothetical protein
MVPEPVTPAPVSLLTSALLLAQVFLDLDDGVLVRAHVRLERVVLQVFDKELVVPLLRGEAGCGRGVCHFWLLT